MPKFFIDLVEKSSESLIEITGNDALHISKTLRMRVGEKLTVTDSKGTDYFTVIESVAKESVLLKIEEKKRQFQFGLMHIERKKVEKKSKK